MPTLITDRARDILSRSLPLVRHHKERIIERMEINLRGAGGDREPSGQSDVAAMLLVQLLLDEARSLVDSGRLTKSDGVLDEHEALDIDGRHYSRFGDALVPILKDELGPNLPREVPAAWCDTFWTVMRELTPQREVAPA